jgi:hypothetical protein
MQPLRRRKWMPCRRCPHDNPLREQTGRTSILAHCKPHPGRIQRANIPSASPRVIKTRLKLSCHPRAACRAALAAARSAITSQSLSLWVRRSRCCAFPPHPIGLATNCDPAIERQVMRVFPRREPVYVALEQPLPVPCHRARRMIVIG